MFHRQPRWASTVTVALLLSHAGCTLQARGALGVASGRTREDRVTAQLPVTAAVAAGFAGQRDASVLLAGARVSALHDARPQAVVGFEQSHDFRDPTREPSLGARLRVELAAGDGIGAWVVPGLWWSWTSLERRDDRMVLAVEPRIGMDSGPSSGAQVGTAAVFGLSLSVEWQAVWAPHLTPPPRALALRPRR